MVRVLKDPRAPVALLALLTSLVAASAALAEANSADSAQAHSAGAGQAAASQQGKDPAAKKKAAAVPLKPAAAKNPYRPSRFAGKAGRYYKLVWGVDSLKVKVTESGEIVRFSWRVLNPDRAKELHDKKNAPALVDPQTGVRLAVLDMERLGKMRQAGSSEEGKLYWMAFSNQGRKVKRGDRVDVVIGAFRAEGLAVE